MSRWKLAFSMLGALALLAVIYAAVLIHRGFSASAEPSLPERIVARLIRNLSIPGRSAREVNPWKATPDNLQEAREVFAARCAVCHGNDGAGQPLWAAIFIPNRPT
jgi:cytochrome c553